MDRSGAVHPDPESVEPLRFLRPAVLAVLSDTHGRDDHGLTDHLLDVAADADRVVHAGDFTTETVFEAFRDLAPRLEAVHGNADDPAVRERLPDDRVLEYGGVRIALTHRKAGGETGLTMFGRSVDADLVVFGHTHRPALETGSDPTLLNPGSHATPRGHRPGYATLVPDEDGLRGTLRRPDGSRVERFSVVPRVGR